MDKLEFERVLCDTLWDIKEKYRSLEISDELHYINTFQRLNYKDNGIEIKFKDNTSIILEIRTQKCGQ